MKHNVRFFIAPLLTFLLCSCTAGRSKGPLTAQGPLVPSRRESSYKVKVAQTEKITQPEDAQAGGGGRRSPRPAEEIKGKKSDLQKDRQGKQIDKKKSSAPGKVGEQVSGKEGQEDSAARSVFKQDQPQGEQKDKPKGPSVPEDIRQRVISSGAETAGEDDDVVDLNFTDAPIEEVLFALSKAINLDFIMGAGVKGGQISMRTTRPIPKSEFFKVLQSALEVNGLTLVPVGRHYKVIYAKEAPSYPIEVMAGKGGDNLPQEESFITQIIPLDYIPVKEMVNILQPFLSKSAPRPIIQHEDLNLMIINDTAFNMKRLLKFVQELDKPIYQPKEKVFVYYVENGDAKKLATILSSIYKKGGGTRKDSWAPPAVQQPPQSQPGAAKGAAQPPAAAQPPFGFPPFAAAEGGEVQGDVTVVAAEDINALIITTSPRNWEAVKETIKKLDVQPKQALIEVLVAEISIDDMKDFGLDWSLTGSASGGITYRLGQDLGGISNNKPNYRDGINYMLSKQQNFISLINTKAGENKLNVLSSPHILASDNQEASIEITQDYPIPRESYDPTSNRTTTTYDYRNAGIKLSFTPKINEKGLVSLKLKQEVSQLAQGSSTDEKYIFSTRKAETSVVVHDGETLVIGGLIKEQKSKGRTGIPFLADIPILGYLFSHTTDTVYKTELIILITPHVINNEDEGRELTRQFQERVKGLKSKIEQGIKKQEGALPASSGQAG